MTLLSGLLACPRCGTALDNLTCRACRLDFPRPGGVPWLFANPPSAISDWKNRWQLARESRRADLRRVQAALDVPNPQATHQRLQTLAAGYQAQQQHLDDVLAPLAQTAGGSLETLLALRTRLPPSQGLFSYEANVHRDWCWGEQECRAALDDVLEALDGDKPERVLVLGAGAGRLAYDLHQHTSAPLTVALDFNPLLAYVGARVSAGEQVRLVEFPRAPRTPGCAAVERRLTAPAPARPGLEFVLADAMRPPFQAEAFDLVVTPWLLDVVDDPGDVVVRRLNGLIRSGGQWINHGSVAFERPEPAERLTLEELLDVMREAGFDDLVTGERTGAYMNCPDSRHGRTETMVTVRATRARPVEAPARHQSLPEWIVDGRSAIPALPAFRTQAMTTRMHAFIMTLIDGQRTLKDLAKLMDEQNLMPRQEAETALRGFLITMYDEAARS